MFQVAHVNSVNTAISTVAYLFVIVICVIIIYCTMFKVQGTGTGKVR